VIAISLLITFPLSTLLIREATAQTTHEVKIIDFAFVPQSLTINPGDTVMWNNTDPVIHTLWFVYVSNGSTYLLSDPIPPDTTWTHTFNDAVELQYYDFDRLWITGFITVQAGVHDVAVINVVPWKTVVGQIFSCRINVTVANEGGFTETFDVTLYANTIVIGTETVYDLLLGTSTILIFMWDATGFAKGSYTITAEAEQVPGETDLDDNTFEDGAVMVAMPCDIADSTTPPAPPPDGKVNYKDLFWLLKAYGSDPTKPNWDPNLDFAGSTTTPPAPPDNKVNYKDLYWMLTYYGKTDP